MGSPFATGEFIINSSYALFIFLCRKMSSPSIIPYHTTTYPVQVRAVAEEEMFKVVHYGERKSLLFSSSLFSIL